MVAAAERSVIITLKLAADTQNKAIAGLVASQAESVTLAGSAAYSKLEKIAAEVERNINQVHEVQGNLRVDLDRQEMGQRLDIAENLLSRMTWIEKQRTKNAETEDDIH